MAAPARPSKGASLAPNRAGLPLSPQQQRLADLIAAGLPDKEIAYRLGLSVGTVRVYSMRVRERLGGANRHEIIRRGLQAEFRALADAAIEAAGCAITGVSELERLGNVLQVLVCQRDEARAELAEARARLGQMDRMEAAIARLNERTAS